MNKEQLITDEMIDRFVRKSSHHYDSLSAIIKDWESFRHQSPKNEWEVVEHKGNDYVRDFNVPIKVCRISDGATLEVGKEYVLNVKSWSNPLKITIESIYGIGGSLMISFKEPLLKDLNIKVLTSIVECNPVLFTTEDGKEIREDDEYWCIIFSTIETHGIWIPQKKIAGKEYENPSICNKYFSSKEEAESYSKEYKPYLSLAMIREALSKVWDNKEFISSTMIDIQQGLSKLKNNQ